MKRNKKRRERSPSGGQRRAAGPVSQAAEAPLSTGKKWLFSIVGFVVLPLLFLMGVEIVLRVAGYGYSTSFFKPMRIGGKDCLVENDDFGLRFFPPELSRSPAPIVMSARKPPGTYRIFVLGDSAALGDPSPAFGAGRYLQVLLRERFPGLKFEVVNVAMTAINSHTVLPIARECARHQGDLWVIYMGNNEMVGPFGATTVFGSRAPPLAYVRLSLAIQQTRLGQLLMALGRELTGRSKHDASWGGMTMFLKSEVPPDSPRKREVYANFKRNLHDILEVGLDSGVKIVLSTMAVNLKDCAPFASEISPPLGDSQHAAFDGLSARGRQAERQDRFAEAARFYTRAATIAPSSAETQFQLGLCYLRETNDLAAGEHFAKARDLDALPFRADSRINQMILEAAHAQANPNLVLCDAQWLFETNSPDLVPGSEWFYEHVHFNFNGNYQLARAWAADVARFLPASVSNRAKAQWASQALCERRLGLTDWNRYAVFEDVARRLTQPPFINQSNHRQQVQAIQAQLAALRRRLTPAAATNAEEIYQEALRLSPNDHRLHENYAQFLEATGRLKRAEEEWVRVSQLIPEHHLAYYQAGDLLLREGKLAEARTWLLKAVHLRPDLAAGWLRLGEIHALEHQPERALEDYARVRKLAPGYDAVYYHVGKALSALNRHQEAIRNFREAIRLNPAFWEAHSALAEELAFAGDNAEARKEYEEVIRLKPDYMMAHLNLGVALVKEGQLGEAVKQLKEATRLDPKSALARRYLDKVREMRNREEEQ